MACQECDEALRLKYFLEMIAQGLLNENSDSESVNISLLVDYYVATGRSFVSMQVKTGDGKIFKSPEFSPSLAASQLSSLLAEAIRV